MNRLTRTTALTLLLITTQVEADNPNAHEVTTSEAPSLSETALSDAETASEKEQGTSDPSTTETPSVRRKTRPYGFVASMGRLAARQALRRVGFVLCRYVF